MTDNYATDEWLMEIFGDWFDPCPLNENFDRNDQNSMNGLAGDWKNKTFVNPPYSRPREWVRKAVRESQKGKTIVLLLRVDTSTLWFRMLVEAGAKFMFINGRLKHRTGKPANFPSMLVVLEGKQETLK